MQYVIVISIIIAALLMRRYVAFPVRVESRSMEPNLKNGQLVIARRIHKKTVLKKGDVVVVYSEELGQTIVKRIARLPGEEFKIGNRTFKIPDGHYFLLGDNLPYSSDSRKWNNPYISRQSIKGVICFLPRV